MRRLLEQSLRHALKKRRPNEPSCVAIRTPGVAPTFEDFVIDNESFAVKEARSLLEMRQILTDSSLHSVVILTGLDSSSVADDILVRLVGGHVHSLNPWDRLADVLGLRSEKDIDSLLRRTVPDLAKELLASLPVGGLPKLAEGRLTSTRAWRLVQEHVFGLEGELSVRKVLELDLSRMLGKWKAAPPALREAFLKSLAMQPDGVAIAWLLSQALKESGVPLVVLGLVVGVVHSGEQAPMPEQIRCQGRLDAWLTSPPKESVLVIHSDSARSLLLEQDARVAGSLLHQAQGLLEQIQGISLAWISDLLPEGFRQRWIVFANALRSCNGDTDELLRALKRLESHQEAKVQTERLRKAQMALRLKRWLAGPIENPTGVQQHAKTYMSDLAWVDRAVHALSGGDAATEFQEAARELLEQVLVRRENLNRSFAQSLSAGQGHVCEGMLAIETVLPELVAPLTEKSRKVLLLVLDGMSWANALEILDELRTDWSLLGSESYTLAAPLLAVGSSIPTITEFARTSLLSGQASKGGQPQEREGFSRLFPAGHLFHKGDLFDQRGQGLSPIVQDRIANSKDLVAVVLNAIDDQLKGSDQLRLHWNRQSIPLLRTLLDLAKHADRIVVLASDHGHVPEAGTQLLPSSEGGERWSAPDRSCAEGEILVRGQRLAPWAGDVIVPWSERIRYAPIHNGYHGGVTPQEWFAPLCVVAPMGYATALPEGWSPTDLMEPDWWLLDVVLQAQTVRVDVVPTAAASTTQVEWAGATERPLYELQGATWVLAIIDSEVMEMQLKIAGRSARKEMAKLALDAFDGAPDQDEIRITRLTMSQRAQVPVARLQGWLALVGRLLNVDNTECFGATPDGQQLYLRPRMLVRQFGVENRI